jgi:hypothetical protein
MASRLAEQALEETGRAVGRGEAHFSMSGAMCLEALPVVRQAAREVCLAG